jgi:hypothetical protein
VIGGIYVGDITHYFVVVHSRSIKLEESSSSGGGRGQERAIGGFSVCKNFNPVNKTRGVWTLGKKGPLTAPLILFDILLASYKLLYMRLGFP